MCKNINFYVPKLAIREIRKYESYLLKKSGYTKEEFERLFSLLLDNIKLVLKMDIKPHMKRAEEIMGNIDIKDSPFIATYLAINADGIWSFDNHFKQQNEIKIFDIEKLVEFL
jgi:predicted nucleic acid-binding protein